MKDMPGSVGWRLPRRDIALSHPDIDDGLHPTATYEAITDGPGYDSAKRSLAADELLKRDNEAPASHEANDAAKRDVDYGFNGLAFLEPRGRGAYNRDVRSVLVPRGRGAYNRDVRSVLEPRGRGAYNRDVRSALEPAGRGGYDHSGR